VKYDPKEDKNQCPIIHCGWKLIQIDENMIPIITTLNQKGYKTTNCCSGHQWSFNSTMKAEEMSGAYIGFHPLVRITSAPDGWVIEEKEGGGYIIRDEGELSIQRNWGLLEKQQWMFQLCTTALKWAMNLPELKWSWDSNGYTPRYE